MASWHCMIHDRTPALLSKFFPEKWRPISFHYFSCAKLLGHLSNSSVYRSCWSVKKCNLDARWRKQKKGKKERKKKLRCDKSHICPDHPRCSTPTKVVMWGGVPDLVNRAKFHQNRLRGFGSLRGWNLPFSYAWCYGLYNSLGLPLNLWWTGENFVWKPSAATL